MQPGGEHKGPAGPGPRARFSFSHDFDGRDIRDKDVEHKSQISLFHLNTILSTGEEF